MTEKDKIRLRMLTVGSVETGLSPKEKAELESMLESSEDARSFYLDLIAINTALGKVGGEAVSFQGKDFDKICRQIEQMELTAPCACRPKQQEDNPIPSAENKSQGWKARFTAVRWIERSALAAAVLCVIFLLYQLYYVNVYVPSRPHQVAQIADSSEALWQGSKPVENENGVYLRSSKEYQLKGGVAKILLSNGVEFLLEEEAKFEIENAERVNVLEGSAYFKVPSTCIGFIADTPTSRIIDLGTEFGVSVLSGGSSELHMFRGRCSMAPRIENRTKSAKLFEEGDAVKISEKGETGEIPQSSTGFLRLMDSSKNFYWHGENISLADILGGGSGTGTGVIGKAVDIASGRYVERITRLQSRKAGYRLVPSSEIVDGVFIPDGEDASQVTSKNHIYDGFEDTSGTCWAPISNGPDLNGTHNYYNQRVVINGQLYGTKENPALYMHSNSAVTFDLRAVRAMLPGQRIAEFRTMYGVPRYEKRGGADSHKSTNADFTVLIDGAEILKKEQVKYGQAFDFRKQIPEDAEFLTLACTDANGSPHQDWGVFARPELVIEQD
ncbi:NPCBM/NEW2 domain-containing protein [Sedimentisphaera salicampi]|uniref:FecR protein n=1 Tax=Sedimentisphaera salicampi TaxID=1941349 RepID=A0A1W6LLJ7_9BACT|nr:NPCBM/NEW2 domain-containing protein [Sedimentisphaera salicampi]ARN56614.1 FecR protein [Sedimentisphaera salicampi]OXU15501.1 FecR protein [Sedimentisphaera salicampi]